MVKASPLLEAIARAICAVETRAPHPDARILIGMREAAAWEARLPQAEAALLVIRRHDGGVQ